MRAIFIDSENETLENVELGDDPSEITSLLKCDLFDVVRVTAEDDLFVDDEGLLKVAEDTKFFTVRGGTPFAGNGLILGHTESGDSAPTKLNLYMLGQSTEFLSLNEMKEGI